MKLDISPLPPVFLTAEARDCAINSRRLTTAVRNGQLLRIGRAVYADPERWPQDPLERHRLLAEAAPRWLPDSVSSHVSAAALQGLLVARPLPPRPCVTVEYGDRSRHGQIWMTVFRGDLPAAQLTLLDGIPVTVVARTIMDCLRSRSLGDGLAMADDAVRRGLVTVAALRTMREYERRWPGVGKAATALELLDPRRESWLESVSAAVFHHWSLPRWHPQIEVLDVNGRFIARCDGFWPELGMVAEADGRGKFLGEFDLTQGDRPSAVARRVLAASDREVELRGLGLGVVRWSSEEILRFPERVIQRFYAERRRADPTRVMALFRCSCCRQPPTSCRFGTGFTSKAA